VEFFPLGKGDGCAQLDWMDLEERQWVHMLLAQWIRGNLPKWYIVWPPSTWGRWTSSKFAQKKSQFVGSSLFVIHITQKYCGKVANFLKFVAWPKWPWNKKIPSFSLVAPGWKPCSHESHGRPDPGYGPIGPWLSHKLCSTVNITPILSTKVEIDCSHHKLHGTFKSFFFNVDAISHF
jgi:hypothetical protein